MVKKENRFEVVYKDGGGITPLLDSEGKVIVTERKR